MNSTPSTNPTATNPTALRDVIADALGVFRDAGRNGSPETWAEYRRLTGQAAGFGRAALDVCLKFLDDGDAARRTVAAKILDDMVEAHAELRAAVADKLVPAIARETRTDVMSVMLMALGQTRDQRTLAIATRLIDDDHPKVAVPAIIALTTSQEDDDITPEGISPLLSVMDNSQHRDMRRWATLAIGSALPVDSEEVSAALARRLFDQAPEVRDEAIVGLARRRDGRAFDAVESGLRSEHVSPAMLRAASFLKDPRLVPALECLVERGVTGAAEMLAESNV